MLHMQKNKEKIFQRKAQTFLHLVKRKLFLLCLDSMRSFLLTRPLSQLVNEK